MLNSQNNQDNVVAVVGSPSTNTELTVDILQNAAGERLVGALVAFNATQSGKSIISVGQIIGIELKNRWHEDLTIRNLIKQTGQISYITNLQDTRTASLVVSATFCESENGYDPEVLGIVPPTGTQVYRVDQALLDNLLNYYAGEIFYLGKAYANDVLYPMWLKHFGSGSGGAGEAYHSGVFGKTGSGKSGLAKMMLCAYAGHKELGILVIDPQGEFSLELQGTRVGQQRLELDSIIKKLNREIRVYSIQSIQLDDWDTFEEILQSSRFFNEIGIPSRSAENVQKAAKAIREKLKKNHRLDQLGTEIVLKDALKAVDDEANNIYSTEKRAQKIKKNIEGIIQNKQRLNKVLTQAWQPICQLFSAGDNRTRLFKIINSLLSPASGSRPVVVIDISDQSNQSKFWSEELQRRILSKLLNILVSKAKSSLSTQQSANVLVLLDEAHRYAPSGRLDEDSEADRLRSLLRRAVRETRKYGIGWFFISQTLGGLDNEILQQLRIMVFGFGLAMGTEFDRLRDFVGGDRRALELYQSFRDPQSFPTKQFQEFPFMAIGPLSPLSFSRKPIFFTAFTDAKDFMRANNL